MQLHEINVKEALEKTKEIVKQRPETIDTFHTYAPIYMGPTGNLKDTVNLYQHKIEKALVVGSHGAFAYELALQHDVKEIDCFDKNILQGLYFSLLNTSIRNVDFEDLKNNFTSIHTGKNTQCMDKMLSEYLFYDVLEKMDEVPREYWSKLFMSEDLIKLLELNLFRTNYPLTLDYLKRYSSLYISKKFYELQKKLNNGEVKINYHICDIDEIHKEFVLKKYDLIMFGNILQYYNQIPALNNVEAINRYVKEIWSPMLNDNGHFQLGYGFEIAANAVSKLLGRDYFHEDILIDFIFEHQLEKEIKKGFLPNMVKRYGDNYHLDFIPGVEERENHAAENLILTYTKK